MMTSQESKQPILLVEDSPEDTEAMRRVIRPAKMTP